MHYLIYKTTNLINNRFYVGKHVTKNDNDGYVGSGTLLKRAIKKHGKENFKTEILLRCDSYAEMTEIENLLIDKHVVQRKDNYNSRNGGDGGDASSGRIWVHTEDLAKRVYSDELIGYLDNGYLLGQPKRMKEANFGGLGRFWSYNPVTLESFFENYIPENCIKGRSPAHNIESTRQSNIGRAKSKETLLKLSLSGKGIKKPGTALSHSKLKWMFNEDKIIRVNINSVEQYISNGWSLGRPYKFKEN